MKYRKLVVDFEVPECIEADIEQMLNYLNNGGNPNFIDIYIDNMKSDINSFEEDLEYEDAWMLRNYYCLGGIFLNTEEDRKHDDDIMLNDDEW